MSDVEQAKVPTGAFDFSTALVLLKRGERVTRAGWNGKRQWVVYQKAYPDGIPINKNTAEATGIPEGTLCRFAPYLMLLNAQGVFIPWLASQGDLLADDWRRVCAREAHDRAWQLAATAAGQLNGLVEAVCDQCGEHLGAVGPMTKCV
jgi:hypothetical protein